MGISKEDMDVLDWLYKMDRETLGEDVCGNNHHFHKGKYDFCPICGCKFKAESEVRQMTNEEAIAILQKIKPTPRRADGKSTTHILEMIALDIAIKALEQEPKTGHWIVEVWNNKEHRTCSVCQRVVDYEPCYHYCPYCGAKLEKESEE